MSAAKTLPHLQLSLSESHQIPEVRVNGVHEFFEAQVTLTPNKVAVSFEESTLTYAQLEQKANRLANYLRDLGVKEGTFCGIALVRSLDVVVSVLAVLKTGAAYVPLDPSYPQARLAFMIEDTQMPVLLSQRKISEKLPCASKIVMLDEVQRDIDNCSDVKLTGLRSHPEGFGPAYVIYTSGSTGKPKGLVMGHRALVNLLNWQLQSSKSAGDGKRTVQFASLSFDVSFQEMFSTWATGGTLVMVSEELRADVRRLWQLLKLESIERLFIPPVVLQHLALAAEKSPDVPTSLREIITAGEQLKITPQIRKLFLRLPECTLQNQYGPSESHVVTSHRLTGDPLNWTELPPIGQPISNVAVHILDDHLQPVEMGVAGELYIGGECLADGYLRRPELSAEKFITNPLGPTEEELKTSGSNRLYRTGDLTRRLPCGDIEFLGRLDHQIKILGHRIEAGEVEGALLSHPNVKEAVVTACVNARSERQLVAYIVSEEPSPTTDELRALVATKLPQFMIPSVFTYLDHLPLTPNGKVNRAALPGLGNVRPKLERIVAPPGNAIEAGLLEIWQNILNVDAISVLDDFFELGGDSLLAVAMLIEIGERFGRNLPVSILIEKPTIKALAIAIEKEPEPRNSLIVPIQPNGTKPPLFLLPPMMGEIWSYRPPGSYLGPDQPIYGIRSRGLRDREQPFSDLISMASDYVEEMLRIQSQEPFFLGGYSFGGTVAFQMAHQLYQQGYRDIKVLIIDEDAPGTHPFDVFSLSNSAANIPAWFRDHVLDRPFKDVILSVKRNLSKLTRHIREKLMKNSKGREDGYRAELAEFLDLSVLTPVHVKVSSANYEALVNYEPKVYPGRLTLFRTRAQRLLSTRGFDKGWKKLAGKGLDIRIIDGNHNTLLDKPHLDRLAQKLESFLSS